MKVKFELEDMDYAYIHDVVIDATNKNLSKTEIHAFVEQLPLYIKAEASACGFSDTCVRDRIYTWLRKDIQNRENQCLSTKN